MTDYIGDLGDFNPLEDIAGNDYEIADPFNFEEKEKQEFGDEPSVVTYNLIRRHRK